MYLLFPSVLAEVFIKPQRQKFQWNFHIDERLSPEGLESELYKLKSDNTLYVSGSLCQLITILTVQEFGINIVGEDNKMIIHHKVAAQVVCVFSEQDPFVAAHAEQHQQQHQHQHQHGQYSAKNLSAKPSLSSPSDAAGRLSQTNSSPLF